MDKIYRFRSIDKVLSTEQLDIKDSIGNPLKGYEELEKQQIYFSPLCQLNDPMEGSKDIYWQGDEIVWENFLIHYLLCLEHVFATYLIERNDISLSAIDIPVFKKKSDFPTEQSSNIFTQICSKFFSNNKIKQYPTWLAARDKNPIRRNELLLYIDSIHLFALKCISNALYENNLMATDMALSEESVIKTVLNKEYFDAQKKLQEEHIEKNNTYEKLYSVISHVQSQLKFITHYNEPETNPNKKFLFSYFPKLYLQEIEKLLYPNAYIACFSNSYQNASMWSHYAGSHEGICLQFKTETKGFLKLNAITGVGGSKTSTRDIRDTTNLPIHKINYKKEFHAVDFFRSIGVLPVPHIYEVWAMDENKNISHVYAHMNGQDEEQWRKKYWELFINNLTTKTKDWCYEEELRLIINPLLIDGEKVSKSVSYDFSYLDGIIFGINTRPDHKEKVIRIIEKKCRKTQRTDFKFYQSYYCSQSGCIEKRELSHLLFK